MQPETHLGDAPPWLAASGRAGHGSVEPSPAEPVRTEPVRARRNGDIDLSALVGLTAEPPRIQAPPTSSPIVAPIVAPRPLQPAPVASGRSPAPGPALNEAALLRATRRTRGGGWRRLVHTLTGGVIRPGESPAETEYRQLLERLRRPVRDDYRVAVLSLKGGVGKTTATVALGATFASLRGDRVIAVDANPDLGTLAQRVPLQTGSTVRDVLADDAVRRYSDVRAHTSQAPSRLEVLASERDPASAETFSEAEYRRVLTILQRYYSIILTDCGTGMSHSSMRGVLDTAHALVIVSSSALDGARSADATLEWLIGHGYGHLVAGAVVVISSTRPGASILDVDRLSQHFLTRCRAVHAIGFDAHLAEGAEIDLDLLGKGTRRSFVEIAATIADDFGSPLQPGHSPVAYPFSSTRSAIRQPSSVRTS